MDHIFSLVTVLRNRKSLNLGTFLCFIDFRRAFDSVNRTILLYKLQQQFGIVGHMYSAVSALYQSPLARVVLADHPTDWFECPLGVKQGDTLSPTLFSAFINDLAIELDRSGYGVKINLPADHSDTTGPATSPQLTLGSLLYADDIVCVAETEADLQFLINIVHSWCIKNRLECNMLKTNIMHVRRNLVTRSKFSFKLGNNIINYCKEYKYLGLTINQFLNFENSSRALFDPAKRALSTVVCKMIKNKGFPYNVYETLYNSCVCSIMDYGHEVIGYHQYPASALLHSKAIRMFLGTGKSAPLCGLRHEMSWPEPRSRTQIKMLNFFFRLSRLPDSRLTKKILLYDQEFSRVHTDAKCWSAEIKSILNRNNLSLSLSSLPPKASLNILKSSLTEKDTKLARNQCLKSKMLCTYNCLFPPFSDYANATKYCKLPLPFILRKRLAQIRLGCLPIRIHADRFSRNPLPRELRKCEQPNCTQTEVESEMHFLCVCEQYTGLRAQLYLNIDSVDFMNYSQPQKFRYLLSTPSVARQVAQFIVYAFDARQT
jgi:hypothetical protein